MAFGNPTLHVRHLMLMPGDTVADFGAGAGFHSLAAAEYVGTGGRVYAIDLNRDLLHRLANAARERGYDNVHVIAGDVEEEGGSGIASGALSAVIAVNIFFQANDKDALAAEIARVLRRGGKALVIDWKDSYNNLGPRARDIYPSEAVHHILSVSGLRHVKDVHAGDHHWGLLFEKQ